MAVIHGRPARPVRSGRERERWVLPLGTIAVVALISSLSMVGLVGSGALFSDDQPIEAGIAAARIFPAERDTPAFDVTDSSSGTGQSASSATAFGGDGRHQLSQPWPATFDVARWMELDFNYTPGSRAVSQRGYRHGALLERDRVRQCVRLRRVAPGIERCTGQHSRRAGQSPRVHHRQRDAQRGRGDAGGRRN